MASKLLSLPILPTALSRTAALSEVVKGNRSWEEKGYWSARRAEARSSRSGSAKPLAALLQSSKASSELQQSLQGASCSFPKAGSQTPTPSTHPAPFHAPLQNIALWALCSNAGL